MKRSLRLSVAIGVCGLLSGLPGFAAAAGFSATGSMEFAREGHTATLLANGQVLVTGGTNATGTLATAELFHVGTGTFTRTGNMKIARVGHTATLLANGQVLITGGTNATGTLATAELFHPANGTFTLTGRMKTARVGHTATLLNDGKVLVVGGGTAKAEIFDPNTGQFTSAGSMSTSRSYHVATLLASGEVLIAGGTTFDTNPTAVGELFNAATAMFTSTANGATTAFHLAAARLENGSVLIAGGELAGVTCGFCGSHLVSSVNTAVVFNSGSASFSETGSLSNSLASHTATLLSGGQVLIAGGEFIRSFCDRGCPLISAGASAVAELYNPTSRTFTSAGTMTTARAMHTSTLLGNGKVLVIGGLGANGTALASAELYQ